MKFYKISTYKDYSIFFWVILVAVLGIIFATVYNNSKIEKSNYINDALENIYLKKTIQEITSNLIPRYKIINYVSKSGDTYEDIIEILLISKKEKKNYYKQYLKKNH